MLFRSALILTCGGLSGAHFNPAVTLTEALDQRLGWSDAAGYVAAQVVGAVAGVLAAHLMFDVPLVAWSTHVRSGPSQMFSEFVATFGLLGVIRGCSRHRPDLVPIAVAAYIVGAYWFTASTSFANPAVTLARTATDTFAGIRPVDAGPFILSQLAGALASTATFRWLQIGRAHV